VQSVCLFPSPLKTPPFYAPSQKAPPSQLSHKTGIIYKMPPPYKECLSGMCKKESH
jgi:hypothetical protein